MWCSQKCYQADAADHEEYECYHPDDLEDATVLEEVNYETRDPTEARNLMKQMIGDELLVGRQTRRRTRALSHQRQQANRRRKRLRQKRRRVEKERRKRRRLRRARREEDAEARRLQRAQEKRDAELEPEPVVADDELVESFFR